jgi:predicted permease
LTSFAALFADNILPIMIAATIGFILQRALSIDPRPLSQAVFYVFTPCFVFSLLVSSQIVADDMLRMAVIASVGVLLMAALSWIVARLLRLPVALTSAFVLTSTFMNSGNFGLPLNELALGEAGLAWASLFFITTSSIVNSFGVYVATAGKGKPLQVLRGVLRIPVIYMVPLALLVRFTAINLPPPVWAPIRILGSAAIPVMLLLLGMHIGKSGLPKEKGPLFLAVGLRLLVSPSIVWVLASRFAVPDLARQAAILEAATPTAVYTTVLASQFDLDAEFASGTVLASTLLCPLTLTPLIFLLGG